ncbi:MAG: CopG family transcriptional regulator [Candidatus Omnitrophota bacterium]|nr:CopG family transcriptional regulator [Candidatus Omnitrophota bacterium]
MTKTQVYLKPVQHHALVEEARERRLSLAALVRELVDQHLHQQLPAPADRSQALLGVIGLGHSGLSDVAKRHDHYLGDATDEHHRKHTRR